MSATLNVNNYCLTGVVDPCADMPTATIIARGPEGGPFSAATVNGLGANAPFEAFSRPVQVVSFGLTRVTGVGVVGFAPFQFVAPLPLPLPAVVSSLRLNAFGVIDDGETYRVTIGYTDPCLEAPVLESWDFTTDNA